MSATITEREVDLSDLAMDSLDGVRHAWCAKCLPDKPPLGEPFVAWCGRRAVILARWEQPWAIPPDACPECITGPCAQCGVRR